MTSILPPLAVCLLGAAPLAQAVVSDDFDRPNSTNLGPDWVESNGDFVIQNLACRGNVPFANDTWMHHSSFSQGYTSAKARIRFTANPADGFFGAGLAIGLDPATWGGVAVLVQDNDLDGLFDRIFFHAAINAGAWFSQPTPVFHDFPAPIDGGELTVWTQDGGDLAVARVEDAAGNLVGTYSASGIVGTPFAPTGDRIGVWARSRPFFDDFYGVEHQALDAYPTSVSVGAGGEQTLDVSLGSARAGELYFVVGALSTASTPIGGGVTLPLALDGVALWTLANPNTPPYADSFGSLDAVGHARATFALAPASPPSYAGLTLHHAAVAIDPVTLTPTAATNASALDLLP